MFRSIACLSAAVALFAAATPSMAQTPPSAPGDAPKVNLRWGLRIPLRDGVQLSGAVYLPKGQTAPAPCVVTITPYTIQTYHDRGVYFAARGLPFLAVDSRGRGNSGGTYRPFIQEADDGADVVEWLAKQPYCNGKVAMWGGSYAGYNQWMAASRAPEHLATIVPAASPFMGQDFPGRGNIRSTGLLRGAIWTSGHTLQSTLNMDNAFWATVFRERLEKGEPFASLGATFGDPAAVALPLDEYLKHPAIDEFWDAYVPTPEQFARIDIPILSITGAYDNCQPGALTFFRLHMKHASPEARARHYLIIGPWDHAGTRTPRPVVGGLKVAPAGLVDLPALHAQWYAWTMGEGPKPGFLKKNVAYYVMGSEVWRYADSLEAVTAEERPFYLDSDGTAGEASGAGSLGARPGRGGPDRYVHDPRDVSGAALEAEVDPFDLTDQRLVMAGAGKQLVYHSAPFAKDTEISGFFKLDAWLSINQPDTDIQVAVYEIAPDGSSVLMTNDVRRARYRQSERKAELITTTKPLRYSFDHFTFISRQVKAGSKLRLVIAPLNSANSEKNYNSGGEVARETLKDARTVTVALWHDRAHPSALITPLGRPAGD